LFEEGGAIRDFGATRICVEEISVSGNRYTSIYKEEVSGEALE
jgi:hypothetical protein